MAADHQSTATSGRRHEFGLGPPRRYDDVAVDN
jgi:hypothetical protein